MSDNTTKLIDRYGRRISYLRVSVTDRCNLNCSYCNPNGERQWIEHNEILRYEEIIRIVRCFARLGVSKVRITGGEPLVRKNLSCLIRSLKQIKGIREVVMTTNGVLLAKSVEALKNAGLDRINISLDTMNPDTFKTITGHGKVDAVLEGIEAALSVGLKSVKLNVVPMAGINEDELPTLTKHFLAKGLAVRFIEQMPIGRSFSDITSFAPIQKIQKRLETELGVMTEIIRNPADGPARRYQIEGYKGEIGFISAMSNHFCSQCNRLRLTADGRLRPCLMDDNSIDIKTLLRNNADDKSLIKVICSAVKLKPEAHLPWPSVHTSMAAIGG